MKLKQNPNNIFTRMNMYSCDPMVIAITLLENKIKLSETDADEYVCHMLTYLHEDVDEVKIDNWMRLDSTDEDFKCEYVSKCLRNMKESIKSYDKNLHRSIFNDKHIQKKYKLNADMAVSAKTAKLISSSELVVKLTKEEHDFHNVLIDAAKNRIDVKLNGKYVCRFISNMSDWEKDNNSPTYFCNARCIVDNLEAKVILADNKDLTSSKHMSFLMFIKDGKTSSMVNIVDAVYIK